VHTSTIQPTASDQITDNQLGRNSYQAIKGPFHQARLKLTRG